MQAIHGRPRRPPNFQVIRDRIIPRIASGDFDFDAALAMMTRLHGVRSRPDVDEAHRHVCRFAAACALVIARAASKSKSAGSGSRIIRICG